MKEKIFINGEINIRQFNELGEFLQEWDCHNLVTLDGAELLAKRFMGDLDDQVRRYAIGYNDTAAKTSDSYSVLETLSPASTDISYSGWSKDNAVITYDFVSPSGFHMGVWREAGLLSVSGTLFNRVNLPEIQKQGSDYFLCTWKLSF
jgi:hypothetical protein